MVMFLSLLDQVIQIISFYLILVTASLGELNPPGYSGFKMNGNLFFPIGMRKDLNHAKGQPVQSVAW